jgi:hypothetical protein
VKKGNKFSDVPVSAWYATAVNEAYNLGYMTGKTSSLFGPNDTLTRAEAVTILHKMADAEDAARVEFNISEGTVSNFVGYTTSFSDVDSGVWYSGHVQWAEKSGITTGYDNGTFGPNDQITREQWATMLARYDAIYGDYSAGSATKLNAFPDASTVSSWATEAVQWTVNEGIITGKNGLIAPADKISRAEAATMAVRYQPERIDATDDDSEASDDVETPVATTVACPVCTNEIAIQNDTEEGSFNKCPKCYEKIVWENGVASRYVDTDDDDDEEATGQE